MISIKHRVNGYLKQFTGEVVGSQELHESGKREVAGLPETDSDEITESGAGLASQPEDPVSPQTNTMAESRIHPSPDPKNRKGRKDATVCSQMVPTIEGDGGPYVKLSCDIGIVYVAIDTGGASEDAKHTVMRMADRLRSAGKVPSASPSKE